MTGMGDSLWWVPEFNRLQLERALFELQIKECKRRRIELYNWASVSNNSHGGQFGLGDENFLYSDLEALNSEVEGLRSALANVNRALYLISRSVDSAELI